MGGKLLKCDGCRRFYKGGEVGLRQQQEFCRKLRKERGDVAVASELLGWEETRWMEHMRIGLRKRR